MRTSFIIAISVLLLVLAACNNQNEMAAKDARLTQMLQGDWASNDYSSGRKVHLSFSARDSLCSVLYPFPPVSRMKVSNGKLYVWEKPLSRENKPIIHRRFAIFGITKNYLKLVALDADSKEIIASIYDDTLHSDTIVLKRITEKNYVQPEIISFYSSGCFGTCPSLALEVDASKNVRYFGDSYTRTEGGQRGQISQKEYDELLRLIHQLPLKTLRPKYQAGWTDDQTCCIAMRIDGKWQACFVYGNDKEPIELRMLLNRLLVMGYWFRGSSDKTIRLESFKAYDTRWDAIRSDTIVFIPPVVAED